MTRELFNRDFQRIESEFPFLQYIERDTQYIISGKMEIFDEDGYKWDEFNVEISIDKSYPHTFPRMKETEKVITPLNSKHIHNNGNLCTCVKPKMEIEKRRGIRLSRFLQHYALSFLAAHIYYVKYDKYPAGEYSHGNLGIQEYYQDTFNTKNNQEIIDWVKQFIRLKSLPSNKQINRNKPCSCGSGIKYKKCHELVLRKIQYIPIGILTKHLNILGSKL